MFVDYCLNVFLSSDALKSLLALHSFLTSVTLHVTRFGSNVKEHFFRILQKHVGGTYSPHSAQGFIVSC